MHADFVTDASRQDIVQSSARNLRLLARIASVFVNAMSQFCQHPTLRYQWMRYLPRANETHWDGVWAQLLDRIRLNLAKAPVLWTRSHRELRCIGNMRRLPSRMLDEDKDPLIGDLLPEQYLASEYRARDLELLTEYGLFFMDEVGFLDRIRQDLDWGAVSMVRLSTNEDWHSRVAKILISAVSADSKRVRKLPLIPLIDGEWKSARSVKEKAIYYSHCEGYPIPTDLSLNLVNPQAEKVPARKELFDYLGVVKPLVSDVRRAIIRRHSAESNIDLKDSCQHIRFLYLTAHLDRSSDSASGYDSVRLFDRQNRRRLPRMSTIFFPGSDPYSAEGLLEPRESEGTDKGAPGLDVSILHSHYMEDCPTPPEGERRTWRTWLKEVLHIRDTVPLTRSGGLSEECLYIAKHRPERFLGFLVKSWKDGGATIMANPKLIKELLGTKVLCENGDIYPLRRTYVPAPELAYIRQFLTEGEFFPWLHVDASLRNGAWLSSLSAMAESLNFGFPQSELEFYLTVLGFVARAASRAKGPLVEADRVFDLYSRIQARYTESATPSISGDTIR